MPRAILVVLDSFGIGGAPDANSYGDAGSDTLGHIAEACAAGRCDVPGLRAGPLRLPNLDRLGLGRAAELATGRRPAGLSVDRPEGRYGAATEVSRGKDTPSGHQVVGVGKIGDIFAHTNVSRVVKGAGNDALVDATLAAMDEAEEGDLLFVNLVDFDMLFGHRRDPAGYAAALERFDARLPEITGRLRAGDLLVLTADHGCDPTYAGTDHTRERVPVLMTGAGVRPGPVGVRASFADIAETIAAWLGLPRGAHGTPIDLSG